MKPNDGGPAFPMPATEDRFEVQGLSLRDYFAGQALANPSIADGDDSAQDADFAYGWADAMLAARAKEQP